MKLSADQIEKKAIAGKTKEGNPVVYIATKGGLHAFFTKDEEGNISSIGAAPHRAIAKFLAGKKYDIEWKDDFHKSEDLEKSEGQLFQRMRGALFTPLSTNGEKTGVYMVYDIHKGSIEVMRKAELMEELKSGATNKYAIVRDTSLSSPVTLAQDCEDLQEGEDE